MSKFRIHRSFEEELAKKADDFSMQPSLYAWQGVEKSITKSQSIQAHWKIGILSLSILAVVGILFIQDDRRSTDPQVTEAGIVPLLPWSESPVTGPEMRNTDTDQPMPIAIPAKNQETQTETETETESIQHPSEFHTEKIVLKNIEPKNLHISYAGADSKEASRLSSRKRLPGSKGRDAWYIQANYGPAYAYRNISARTDYARPLEDTKKQLDKGVSGFSIRLQARYHFSDRFSLAFGLGYTRSGERIGIAPKKNSPVYTALAEQYNYETSEMNTPGDISYYSNQYNYTELPVTLYSKRPLSPRLSLTTGLGLSLGYMAKTNARCYDYRIEHYVNNAKFFRDWTVSSHAQVLLEYSLNTRWSLAAGPEFTYALLSTYRNYYTLSQHQFSVGMNFGVQWKLFDLTKSRLSE